MIRVLSLDIFCKTDSGVALVVFFKVSKTKPSSVLLIG